MPGSVFTAGETKVRPGVYVRVVNAGEPVADALPQGIVAALFRASWGPLGVATVLEGGVDEVKSVFGSSGTVAVAEEAFRGRARRVVAYRLGTGGAKATVNLQDTDGVPVDVVRIDARYEGVRGNDFKVTVRTSLSDATRKELVVYDGTTVVQRIQFPKGGGDEAQALVDAVAASGSLYITATKLATGNGTLADANQVALTGGTDPTVAGADYSTALDAIETVDWNVLATDSEDPSIHTTIQSYLDRVRSEGKRVMGVVGEPTSVALSTRLTNAKALNAEFVVYVANGFRTAQGDIEGYKAAGRLSGMIAAAASNESLTHAVVNGATDLVGGLTNPQVEDAINSGALVFTLNARRQVQVEYGINTLVTLGPNQDAGWRKIRRVKTRDELMNRIVAIWDPLIGKVNNNADGRATLIAAANGVVHQMIAEGKLDAIEGGKYVYEDPSQPPSGDSAWFVVQVKDLDSAEHLYLTFGFQF